MSNSIKHDLLNNVPIVGGVNTVVDSLTQVAKRLFGHSQGQAIAEAIRESLHEYVPVADKFGVAQLIEAQTKFLEVAARLEEAHAAARRADADYLRAETLHEFLLHTPHDQDAGRALTLADTDTFQAQAMQEILMMMREVIGNHIADFDTVIAHPLLKLLPAMAGDQASASPRQEMDVSGE